MSSPNLKFALFTIIGLTLFISFPIFKPGPILLLDSVAAPAQAIGQKLFLISFILVGLLGTYSLVCRFDKKVIFASLLFWVTTPFYIERLAVGQWRLLAAVSLLPWLLFFGQQLLIKRQKRWLIAAMALVLFMVFEIYSRAASFLEIIIVAAILTWVLHVNPKIRWPVRLLVGTIIIGAVLVIFQLAGNYFGGVRADQINASQLSQFVVGQGLIGQRLLGALSYVGFWAGRAQRLPFNFAEFWYWYLPGLIWIGLSSYGWYHLYKAKPAIGIFTVSLYLLSLIVVISNNERFNEAALLSTYNQLGFTSLRETGKFMGLMLVAQIFGLAWGIQKIKNELFQTMFFATLIFAFVSTFSLANLSLQPTPYPPTLVEYAQIVNRQNIKVIVLPWHRFASYSFSRGKVIDQFAPALFSRTVFNEMYEFGDILTNSADPWQRQMADVTSKITIDSKKFNDLLAEREVDNILVMKDNDFQKYLEWAAQAKLLVLKNDPQFVVYQAAR